MEHMFTMKGVFYPDDLRYPDFSPGQASSYQPMENSSPSPRAATDNVASPEKGDSYNGPYCSQEYDTREASQQTMPTIHHLLVIHPSFDLDYSGTELINVDKKATPSQRAALDKLLELQPHALFVEGVVEGQTEDQASLNEARSHISKNFSDYYPGKNLSGNQQKILSHTFVPEIYAALQPEVTLKATFLPEESFESNSLYQSYEQSLSYYSSSQSSKSFLSAFLDSSDPAMACHVRAYFQSPQVQTNSTVAIVTGYKHNLKPYLKGEVTVMEYDLTTPYMNDKKAKKTRDERRERIQAVEKKIQHFSH